jgi:hypothetical protein
MASSTAQRRHPRNGIVLWSLIVLLSLGVTGCGLFGGSDMERIAEAGTRTTEAGSAKVAVTTIIDGGFGQFKQRTDASGMISFADNLTQLEMRVGIPQLAGASSSANGVPMLVIGDGQSMYMRSTTAAPDQPWARVPVAGEEGEGQGLGASNDLGAQLRLLGGGVTEIEEVGEEDVRGEPSTHYKVTIDLLKAVEEAPEEERAALQQLVEQNSVEQFPMELWIGDGHVRRMSYSIDLPAGDGEGEQAAAGGEASVSTVIEYFDFGIPVVVQIPENVVDVEDASAAVPADGQAAPADGQAAPAEGQAAPAEGQAAPAEEQAPAGAPAPPAVQPAAPASPAARAAQPAAPASPAQSP